MVSSSFYFRSLPAGPNRDSDAHTQNRDTHAYAHINAGRSACELVTVIPSKQKSKWLAIISLHYYILRRSCQQFSSY